MSRSRGRPAGTAAGAIKGQIVEAAAEIFAKAGYAGARIESVAQRAGCNRSLIYFYFKDKAGLFRAVLDDVADQRRQQMAAQPSSLAQALVYWFGRNMDDNRRIRLVMQEALAEESQSHTPPGRIRYLNQQLEVVKAFQARGLLRADLEPRHLLTVILALTSFPACFPKVAKVALDAPDAAAYYSEWSECLTRMAEILSPQQEHD